jgi:hypothetical protein
LGSAAATASEVTRRGLHTCRKDKDDTIAMLTPKENTLLQQDVSIDGDGNVVGNDNTVQVTRVEDPSKIVLSK